MKKKPPDDKTIGLFDDDDPKKKPDEPTGKELRDDGIKRAVDHADAVETDWSRRALGYFRQYALRHPEFMTEVVRKAAERDGFPEPPDKRAWGHVALAAAKAGYVKKVGWSTASDPKVHCNPASLWRSSLCP